MKNDRIIAVDILDVIAYGIWSKNMSNLVEEKFGISAAEYSNNEYFHSMVEKACCGEISGRDLWVRTIEQAGWGVQEWCFFVLEDMVLETPIQGTRELIYELRRKGYRMIIVSDIWNAAFMHIKLKHSWIFQAFDRIYLSFQIGRLKSQYGFFELLTSTIDIAPSNLLLIDNHAKNIKNARSAGCNTIQFEDAIQTRKALVDMGVL